MITKKQRFKKIYVEITNVCNLNCPFCLPLSREKEFMSVDNFSKILKEIKDYTNYIYLHIKGEPLIHPNLLDILDLCYQHNILVNITTNGTLINKSIDILLNAKAIRQLNISIHSLSQFDIETQTLYLDEIINLIEKVSANRNFYISLRFWLGSNHLQSFALNYLEEKFHMKMENKMEISKNVFVSFDEEFIWPEVGNSPNDFVYCYGIKDHIGILVDGTVVPCCLDGNGLINLGNIFNTSLKDILDSERYKRMLQAFSTRSISEELCKKCNYKDRFL